MKAFLIVLVPLFFVACTSSSIVVGQTRAPIPSNQVKLFLTPPTKFDQIALINTDDFGVLSFTGQGHMNAAISRAKREAAKLGANGLLLRDVASTSGGSVTFGTATPLGSAGATPITFLGNTQSKTTKNISAFAIFVHEE